MRKLILTWLFGTDDIEDYFELLRKKINYGKKNIEYIDEHIKTLDKAIEDLNTMRKLIKVCENHGIDVDEEIKHVEL